MNDLRTQHQHYPVPVPDNFLQDDVVRLAEAITAIDTDMHQHHQRLHKLKHRLRRLRLDALLS